MAAVSSPQSWRTRSAPPSSSTAFARSSGSITKRSKTGEPEAICRGETNRALAAGSQTMTAAAPASTWARRERWTASSARARPRSTVATSGSSSARMPRPARATAAIGSASELRREREGADRHAEGREAGRGGDLGDRVEVRAVAGQERGPPPRRGPARGRPRRAARRSGTCRARHVGPDTAHQVGLLEPQVHQGDGQGRAVALGRLSHDAGQPRPSRRTASGSGRSWRTRSVPIGVRSPAAASARKWSAERRRGRVGVGMPAGRTVPRPSGPDRPSRPRASGSSRSASGSRPISRRSPAPSPKAVACRSRT